MVVAIEHANVYNCMQECFTDRQPWPHARPRPSSLEWIFEKISNVLMIDTVLESRPAPKWCLETKKVQEDAKLDAHILGLDQDLLSIRTNITAESTQHGTSHKLTSHKLSMIENLQFDGLGQVLIHVHMGLDFPIFLSIGAKEM